MSIRERVGEMAMRAALPVLAGFERARSGVAWTPVRDADRADPYPAYRALRERDPVHRSMITRGWVITRYDDALSALRDPRFSADERNSSSHDKFVRRMQRAGIWPEGEEPSFSMLRMDPPDHTRLRGLVSKAFTSRAIEAWRPRVRAVVDELLESAAERGGDFELVRDFGAPLPVTVIAEMLGVPARDHEQFRRWSDDVIRTLGLSSLDDMRASRDASNALRAYMAGIADERRAEPRDDLISGLVQAEEAGDRLSADEILATCELLLVAGNETTTNLISNAVVALQRNAGQWKALRESPELIESAVEEVLRYDSPVQATSRIALEDVELRGRRVRRGEEVIVLLGAANRDPEVFDRAEELVLDREENRHLAFSQGVHFCLGAQLARLEARVALEGLLSRFPDLTLAEPAIEWSGNIILRGPVRLPLHF